jgi:hypothetical protein
MNRFLPAAAALFLVACGYVGDPLPPLEVFLALADLAAVQRAPALSYSSPFLPARPRATPIPPPCTWTCAPARGQFEENQWAEVPAHSPTAMAGECNKARPGPAHSPLRNSVSGLDRQSHFRVRAVGGSGKQSGWSVLWWCRDGASGKPSGVTATTVQPGCAPHVQAHGTDFRVFRKTEGGTLHR